MLLVDIYKVPAVVALGIVAGILIVAVFASLLRPPPRAVALEESASLRLTRRRFRKREREGGTRGRNALHFDRAAMRLRNSARDGESQPNAWNRLARGSGAPKWFEDVGEIFRRDADALVGTANSTPEALAESAAVISPPDGEYLIALLRRLFSTWPMRVGSQG